MKPMRENCATCPFTTKCPKFRAVRALLSKRALTEATPICHSTGPEVLSKRIHDEEHACRGDLDLQLQIFHALGVIEAPTDQAWEAKWKEMNQ